MTMSTTSTPNQSLPRAGRAVLARETERILKEEARAIRARFESAQRAEEAEFHLRNARLPEARLNALETARGEYLTWCLAHTDPAWWTARRSFDPVTDSFCRCPGCWAPLSLAEATLAERPGIQCCSSSDCGGKGGEER